MSDLDDEELEATRKLNGANKKSDIEILEKYIKKLKLTPEELLKNDEIIKFIEYKQIQAIENLIQENKELKEYKKIAELTKISCCTAQNCETLNNAIKNGLENEKLIQENKELKEKNTLINHLYKNLKDDFDSYKKDKDINYLDNNHHKNLVEKSIGQIINKPEECWFDAVEVKIIRNNILYGVNIDKDFITLKEISDEHPDMCMTVIAESPLSGAIYRYNNYGKKEWQLIGTMYGYA